MKLMTIFLLAATFILCSYYILRLQWYTAVILICL